MGAGSWSIITPPERHNSVWGVVALEVPAITPGKGPAPANDAGPRKSAIVTAQKPRTWRSDVPDMAPEEHRQRGDTADALFREMKRRIAGARRVTTTTAEEAGVTLCCGEALC